MLSAALRRSGGSLIVTIPQAYIEQNHLQPGTRLEARIVGDELKFRPARQRPSLQALLNATPEGTNRVDGWDEMPATGGER